MVEGIALALLFAVVLHQLMAIPQAMRLRKELAEIKKSGPATSVGMAKSWKGKRYYALVADLDGNVLGGYSTGGATVFGGFNLDKGLRKVPVRKLIESIEEIDQPSLLEQAQLMAARQLEDGLAKRANRMDS